MGDEDWLADPLYHNAAGDFIRTVKKQNLDVNLYRTVQGTVGVIDEEGNNVHGGMLKVMVRRGS